MCDDQARITEAVTRMTWYLDRRDWDRMRTLFTETMCVDYTALYGGTPQRASADELLSSTALGSWRRTMDGLDATQHVLANILVDVHGDAAVATANLVATHRLANQTGSSLWTLGGTYEFGLERAGEGWLISAITLGVSWAEGNQQLLMLAASAGPS